MGKMQRAKGYRGEKECVDLLRSLGFNATRTAMLQAGDDNSEQQSIDAPDVMADYMKKNLMELEPNMGMWHNNKIGFDIECKIGKQVPKTIYKWWEQTCKADHVGDAMPLLYMRRDHEKALWVVDTAGLERMVKA